IGANVAVFSVVNTLLLRPLPFPDSHQLVWVAPPPSGCGLSCATYSADAYEEFRAQSRAYQDVTGYFAFSTPDNLRLTVLAEPQPATSIEVIGNFFQVLGVQPAIGRMFTADEVRGGPHPWQGFATQANVALLANAYWRRQFAADPGIVGKAIELNGTPVTVVGVLPASFEFGAVFSPGAKVDLFTPLNLDEARDWGNIVTLLGRLKPGVTAAQALEDAKRIAPNIYFNVKYPETLGSYKGALIPVPLKDYVTGKLRRSLIALWCAVGAILLIAGVNLSNLLLARAAARAKEFAIRGALGASRGRIVRQLLLVSAGLLLRSFVKVLDVDLGFQPDRAASIKVDYDDSGTSFEASAAKRAAIFQRILAGVTALPGVEAAGIADYLPLGPNREWDTPVPQGKTFPRGALPDPLVYVITPGFIRAMGIRLQGRDFSWTDGPHSQRVVIINASAAGVYWAGEDALGKML